MPRIRIAGSRVAGCVGSICGPEELSESGQYAGLRRVNMRARGAGRCARQVHGGSLPMLLHDPERAALAGGCHTVLLSGEVGPGGLGRARSRTARVGERSAAPEGRGRSRGARLAAATSEKAAPRRRRRDTVGLAGEARRDARSGRVSLHCPAAAAGAKPGALTAISESETGTNVLRQPGAKPGARRA